MRRVTRGGHYLRVADPRWPDPLDAGPAMRDGGRWNPPSSFPVLYLCADRTVARGNVGRLLADAPYGPEDLAPKAAPLLVEVEVADAERLDLVSAAGCEAVGLPGSYPIDSEGATVSRLACQPVGEAARVAGLEGVAARSVVARGEELAHFPLAGSPHPRLGSVHAFDDWFWSR